MSDYTINKIAIYRITELDLTENEVEEMLSEHEFKMADKFSQTSAGWIKPYGADAGLFAPCSNGAQIISLRSEKKKISSSEVKAMLDAEIAKLKAKDPSATIGKDIKKNIKTRIEESLLPKATSSISDSRAIIDRKNNLFIVEGTLKNGEDMCLALKSLFSDKNISLHPLRTKEEPGIVMTDWLKETSEPPASMIISNFAELSGIEGENIAYKKFDVTSDDSIKTYLNSGYSICKLKIIFNSIEFKITDDFHFPMIEWKDNLEMQVIVNVGDSEQTPDVMGDAYLSEMISWIRLFVDELVEKCFGGEASPDELDDNSEQNDEEDDQ